MAAHPKARWNRIVLKLSGEALAEKSGFGLDSDVLHQVATELYETKQELGVDIAVVVGGGNFFRGAELSQRGMERSRADYMGMLATMINSMALQASLEKMGLSTRLQSAIKMEQIAEPFIRRKAIRHLEKGRIVIFAAGVGAPFFTTDSGAALRAAEMQCDALFKGTSVDGVYDADPKKVASATRYETLSYDRVLADNLKVMDASAVSLCRDNNIPIVVFSIREQGNILKVLDGSGTSTVVTSEGN